MTRVDPMKKSTRSTSPKSAVKPANDQAVANYFSHLPQPPPAAILSACPKSTIETLSYGIPTFKHSGSILAIAAFRDHCSLFPMSYFVIDKFRPQLSRVEVSKGTVRFPITNT